MRHSNRMGSVRKIPNAKTRRAILEAEKITNAHHGNLSPEDCRTRYHRMQPQSRPFPNASTQAAMMEADTIADALKNRR